MASSIDTLLSRRQLLPDGVYNYEVITRRCAQQLFQFMGEARRRVGVEAQARRERGYGVYLAWRAVVMENADPSQFRDDDQLMEQMLGLPSRRMGRDEGSNNQPRSGPKPS